MTTTAALAEPVPIQGYDKLDMRGLVAQLRLRSQVELTGIESYERSNQGRAAVLDKLRYLRNDEPFDGYDALEPDAILAALADSDLPTLQAVRNYEVKLRDREEVLVGLADLRRGRATLQGAIPAPADEPADRWPGDAEGGVKGAFGTVGVFAALAVCAVLLLVLISILVFVVLTAVAPDVLIR